ncbi:MAG: non-ribosomal peptide synthetase, partial [Chthoniobacterales bacterium]
AILDDAPVWRSALLSLGKGERAWVWSHHHALCDNFVAPLLRGIFGVYDRLLAGAVVESEPASPDFYDYLRWRETQDWSAAQADWRERFKPGDRMTALPEVRGSLLPDDQTNRIAVNIAPETNRALRELCLRAEITLNTVVIAAWGLWLARTQEERRAIFAIMRGARKATIPGAESIFGFFTNTVPIAVPISDDISMVDWLRDVRREIVALRSLEYCSLGEIAQWTGLELGPEGPASVINFLRMGMTDELRASGLPEKRTRVSLRQTVDVPLMINACELPQLHIDILARAGFVSMATARAAARGLSAILSAIVAAPQSRLGEIDLLSEYDHAILEKAEYGPRIELLETNAHALLERQIRERPDALAIKQGARELTFAQLDELAEQVAQAIAQAGLTSDVVAVVLPPGPEIVAAMLGILRAGAAFLLLNPAAPRLERERMLRRLSISVAFTDETFTTEIQAAVPRVLEFAEIARTGLTSTRTRPEIRANDLAYLVHTSGSTGEKKFVEIEHRSLANTIRVLAGTCRMQPGDRRIARATPGNDYFITEVLTCLSGGGLLIFPERGGAMTIAEFDAMLRRERITVTGIPTSYWHEWVRALDENGAQALPPDLRFVICAMEKVDPSLLAKWKRMAGDRVDWINAYGPAEATIVSTIYHLRDEAAPDPAHVPIGRPIDNTEVYVLDARHRKLPVGVTGEIAVAGLGVARGYRADENATRKKFVANPHSRSNEFSRLYLTGDYGYVDGCGQLVFVGRRDEQIKIAGHRIELGEIENALSEYPGLRQVVITAEGSESERRLVAHLVPNGAFAPDDLRGWMEHRLMPQMRPADFVAVETIPIMPTGKVDRRALSAVYQTRAKLPNECKIEHGDATEGKLFALFNELFGDRHLVGRSDSFFHLGGNSLLAVRLLARIETELGANLSVHDLFTHPTIAGLAAFIDQTGAKHEFLSLIKMNEGGAGPPLFIVHGWSGGVFHCLEFARRLEDERPVFGLQAVELADRPRHRTVEEMAAHYAEELMRAHPGISYELFGHSLGGVIAYATACELLRRGERVTQLYVVDTLPPNLPRAVHVARVRAELRPRVL